MIVCFKKILCFVIVVLLWCSVISVNAAETKITSEGSANDINSFIKINSSLISPEIKNAISNEIFVNNKVMNVISLKDTQLKNKKLDGIKFRRQHPVSRFVVDFYCHSAKLVVELDGGIHKNAKVKENDANRQYELENFGLKVIRFSNDEVLQNIATTLNRIRKAINLQLKMFESNDQQ